MTRTQSRPTAEAMTSGSARQNPNNRVHSFTAIRRHRRTRRPGGTGCITGKSPCDPGAETEALPQLLRHP